MSRLPPRALGLLLGALALPIGAAGQAARGPAVDAGDVATIIVREPAPRGVSSAEYRLDLDYKFRLFVADEGRVRRTDDDFLLAITFATPSNLPAGDLTVGEVTLRVPGREPVRRELVIPVRARRRIAFHLDVDETTVPPDAYTSIPYRVYNRGNLPDTVRVSASRVEGWEFVDHPPLVIPPGDSVAGQLEIAAPSRVQPGDRQLVIVSARSSHTDIDRTLNVVVVSPTGWLGGLAHVPSSVFVGQAIGEAGGTVAALSGGGRVGPETNVQLAFRYMDSGGVDPNLQRQLGGARLRMALSNPGFTLALGDVVAQRTTLTGSLRQGLGFETVLNPEGTVSLELMAAVPSGFGGEIREGRIVEGRTSLKTGIGTWSVLAGDVRQSALGLLPSSRSTGAGARWDGSFGSHTGSAEVTYIEQAADTSAPVTGPAVDLRYRYDGSWLNGQIQWIQVPGAAALPGGMGNEVWGSFSARLLPWVHAVGWGYRNEQNQLGIESQTESYMANLGLRVRGGGFQMEVAGRLMDRDNSMALDSVQISRATIRSEATWTVGSLSMQLDGEAGRAEELGHQGPFVAGGMSVRWYGPGRVGWGRLQQYLRPGNILTTAIQTGGSFEAGPVSLSGGFVATMSGDIRTTSFWSAAELAVQRNLALHFGASTRPSGVNQEWTFSVGVRRRLQLPLPFAREPDLSGVVFDDRDDDGRLDPGEDVIEGVGLMLGYLRTTSDDRGRFSFPDASGGSLRILQDRLPIGYLIRPDVVLPARGHAAIPLVRAAVLQLDLFLDRDGDGVRDSAESVGEGVVLILTDDRGRTRTAEASVNGTVRITGLLPGHYSLSVQPRQNVSAGSGETLLEVGLAPGAEAHMTLAVPARQRAIQMNGGGAGGSVPFWKNKQ